MGLWNPPVGIQNPRDYVIRIRVRLGRDGRLSAPPMVLTSGSGVLFGSARDNAVRAVFRGQPFDMLRPEHYETWKDIEVTFDPRDMFRVTGTELSAVQMHMEGGIYVVPVLINEAITLDFVVDSGAADVSIPADVVSTLMRTGTLKTTDFRGEQIYRLADGSTLPSQTFRIRSLKVGNKILENVKGSIGPAKGDLLLGQSFLSRFKSWSVDNDKHALVLK
jgi:predicted aspartyl protease